MAKFMFLYRGGDDCATERSPEEMQQAMQAMGEWIQDGMQSGWLVDVGDGLKSEGRVIHADNTVTDGPFAESKELIGGYCIVEASDLTAASELALAMPRTGGKLEVREMAGHSMDNG